VGYRLEAYLRQFRQTHTIGSETTRRMLARYGLRFLTGQTWCESDDPQFEVKKTPS